MDDLTIGDVIQLDPRFSCWGPALCIVEEVRAWGVLCFFFADFKRDESPAVGVVVVIEAHLRVKHGEYARIGAATWLPERMTSAASES